MAHNVFYLDEYRIFHANVRRMCILVLLDEIVYNYIQLIGGTIFF